LDLAQSPEDSTVWTGALVPPAGTDATDLRIIVQAANGVGLVTFDTRGGTFHRPVLSGVLAQTSLTLDPTPTGGRYGQSVVLGAMLRDSAGAGMGGRTVQIGLAAQRLQGVTDPSGRVEVSFPLNASPGEYLLQATFLGTDTLQLSSDTRAFTIEKQQTTITLESVSEGSTVDLVATATDSSGVPLGERAVVFLVKLGDTVVAAIPAFTDASGQVRLGGVPMPPASYTVEVHLAGTVSLPGQEDVEGTDDNYEPSESTTAYAPTPQPAAVTYSGERLVSESGMLNLAAQVTTAAPGADLGQAFIRFTILDLSGAVVAVVDTQCSADGYAVAAVEGLPSGGYQIRTEVLGAAFQAPQAPLSSVVVADDAAPCLPSLVARPKAGLVQLVWTHSGAHHYNVYRSLTTGGPYAFLASTTSTYSSYTDMGLVNGRTYYYVVRPAEASGEEVCQSPEVRGTPVLPRGR
jgi:hypothetical protein